MNTRYLETFVAVAQTGSFLRAAQERYATPSTLIKQVNSLEQHLGVELLRRGSAGVSLTPAGEVYLQWAKELLVLSRKAREDAQVAAGLARGRIRFGTYRQIERVLLKEVLAAFEKDHPHVAVEFVEGDHRLFCQWLADDRIDVYVYPWGAELDRRNIGFQLLGTTELSCIVSHAHPLAKRRGIAPADLAGCDVIVGCGSTSRSLQGVWDELLEAAPGVRLHDVSIEEEMWEHIIGENHVLLNMEYSSRYLGGGVSLPLQWPRTFEYGFVFRTPCGGSLQAFLDQAAALGSEALR